MFGFFRRKKKEHDAATEVVAPPPAVDAAGAIEPIEPVETTADAPVGAPAMPTAMPGQAITHPSVPPAQADDATSLTSPATGHGDDASPAPAEPTPAIDTTPGRPSTQTSQTGGTTPDAPGMTGTPPVAAMPTMAEPLRQPAIPAAGAGATPVVTTPAVPAQTPTLPDTSATPASIPAPTQQAQAQAQAQAQDSTSHQSSVPVAPEAPAQPQQPPVSAALPPTPAIPAFPSAGFPGLAGGQIRGGLPSRFRARTPAPAPAEGSPSTPGTAGLPPISPVSPVSPVSPDGSVPAGSPGVAPSPVVPPPASRATPDAAAPVTEPAPSPTQQPSVQPAPAPVTPAQARADTPDMAEAIDTAPSGDDSPRSFVVPTDATAVQEAERPAREGWLARLRGGLARTRSQISSIFSRSKIDESLYEELETALLASDTGYGTTEWLLNELRARAKRDRISDAATLKAALTSILTELLTPLEQPIQVDRAVPLVMMITGVNGAGKTTSIGKLARHLHQIEQSVLLAAGDTFRAAAREQLARWGERNQVQVIASEGGDPAAVAFDAVKAGQARKVDVVMIDTAGRLPTQRHLMDELKKVRRVIGKAMDGAPHEVLLVLDGNTGQNMLAQVQAFDEAVQLTGLIVTKLDGTAKGGAIAALAHTRRDRPLPVYFIGVGEGVEDLQAFSAEEFASALLH